MKNDYLNSATFSNSTSAIAAAVSASIDATTSVSAAAGNELVSPSEEHSKLTIAVLGVIYSLIFLIGITGNSLGLLIHFKN